MRTSCRILPGSSSRKSLHSLPCRLARNRSVLAATSGRSGNACIDVIRLSRPNGTANHGIPAVGTRLPSMSSMSSRKSCSARRSSWSNRSWSVSNEVAADLQEEYESRMPTKAASIPARVIGGCVVSLGTISSVIERDSMGGRSRSKTATAIGGTTRPSARGSIHSSSPGNFSDGFKRRSRSFRISMLLGGGLNETRVWRSTPSRPR